MTLRDNTERPETITEGTNELIGTDPAAIAPAMQCAPSRNCFISGLYPHNIGMYHNGQLNTLQRRVWTCPAAMRRSGYYSAYVGKRRFPIIGSASAKPPVQTSILWPLS